jgi:hypothetical protein
MEYNDVKSPVLKKNKDEWMASQTSLETNTVGFDLIDGDFSDRSGKIPGKDSAWTPWRLLKSLTE